MRVANAMLVLAAAMALPVVARAAEADTMTVTGQITAASSCDLSLQNGGSVNYGIILAATLQPSGATTLEEKRLTATISCTAPTYIALKLHDERWDSGDGGPFLGLGFAKSGWPIGTYTVTTSFNFETMTLNGSTGYVLDAPVGGNPSPGVAWDNTNMDSWWPDRDWRTFGLQNGGFAERVSTAVFPLIFYTRITGLNANNVTGVERIDGRNTIEIFYM